ncbi:MAG: hypothetical protein R2794_02160 [Chitinophagales bacterium]
MNEWWTSLETFDRTVWAITIVVSLIFIIQMVMSFMGVQGDTGATADFDSNLNTDVGDIHDGSGAGDHLPFQFFTFRNFINFFLGFGWTIIALRDTVHNQFILIAWGTLVGCFMVAMVFYIFYYMTKLTATGTMNIRNALHGTGSVYIPIPGNKMGMGKVQITVQGSLRELDAITEGDTISTGSMIKVKEIVNGTILLVEKV